MITPAEIIKKGSRKFQSILRDYLEEKEPFPLLFPVGKLPTSLSERRSALDRLTQQSKEYTGSGYSIEWRDVNQRHMGKQTVPTRILIESLDDYLTLVRKKGEYQAFVQDVALIRSRQPSLAPWLLDNTKAVIENHGRWGDLLTVCHFFLHNQPPYGYIRELPIPVHTKFIEQNTKLLSRLLDVLLPPDRIDSHQSTFVGRYGLKEKPPLIRCRLLEEQLDWQHGLRLDDLSLPTDQLNHLLSQHIKPKKIFIVENLINFLTLPRKAESVALFGKGYAIHLLKTITWLEEAELIYWGDIDAHGFQILSDLRSLFPHVRSVLMDQQTFEENQAYIINLRPDSHATPKRFQTLTPAERELAEHVTTHSLRLEQEHIPHAYVLKQL